MGWQSNSLPLSIKDSNRQQQKQRADIWAHWRKTTRAVRHNQNLISRYKISIIYQNKCNSQRITPNTMPNYNIGLWHKSVHKPCVTIVMPKNVVVSNNPAQTPPTSKFSPTVQLQNEWVSSHYHCQLRRWERKTFPEFRNNTKNATEMLQADWLNVMSLSVM